MKDGCSLASPDDEVRKYWVTAGINGRRICEAIGRELGCTVFNNTWTPDGVKDNTADRMQKTLRKITQRNEFYTFLIVLALAVAVEITSGQFFTPNNAVDLASAMVVPGLFAVAEFMRRKSAWL